MLCVQASELCVLFVKNQLHVLIFMLEWFIQNCLNGLVQVTILSLYTLYKTPYCEYFLDCGKKFKRKFDLNRHRVTVHLGVRNFPCDLCGKRFADMKDMTRHKNAVHYGMKIKWNSRKNKEKAGRMRGQGRHGALKREDGEERQYRRREQSAEVKLEDGSVSIPVEYIETVETSGEEISIGRGGLEGSTVILDPVLQSQLAAVQGGPGEPRVLIEADPENSGGLRWV